VPTPLWSKSFFGSFFSKKELLIPTVIKNDRWDKPYFWRAAAPPAPRAIPNATKDESSFVAFVAFGITCLAQFTLAFCGAACAKACITANARPESKNPALAVDVSFGAGTPSRAVLIPSTPNSRVETGHWLANQRVRGAGDVYL
jgi:hypothetical protein